MDRVDEVGIDFESGSVVLEVTPRKRPDGSGLEWTYRLWRRYVHQDREKVAFFFRHGEHDEDVSRALVHAIRFMAETDPEKWLTEQHARAT